MKHKFDFLWRVYLFCMIARASKVVSLSSSSARMSMSGAVKTKNLHIHWFRHGDLRLHDNPALCHAIQQASENKKQAEILPVFCFDPRLIGDDARSRLSGELKCGPRRAQFVMESVTDLRSNLESLGSGLIVAHGRPEDVFQTIIDKAHEHQPLQDVTIYCQEEVASEEISVDKAVRSVLHKRFPQGGRLQKIWGSTLYNPEDLPFNGQALGMPDVFTPFRNKVEKNCKIGKPLPSPSKGSLSVPEDYQTLFSSNEENNNKEGCTLSYLPKLEDLGYSTEQVQMALNPDPRGVMHFRGGETAALARVKDYIWTKDRLKIYFDTRNGMLGPDFSTKFSPWLAHGCLSPRYIAKECKRYETETGIVNKSTYWVVFELVWRDFCKFFAIKQGNKIFFLDGTLGREAHGTHPNSRKWGLDKRQVTAWREGKTGYPLVDANMRELALTGYMSNRGRQNVASFLALDTNTDWRYGAEHFEEQLLDYDIYSNWVNWLGAAGMMGGRLNRFNIVKQSKDYDSEGEYVKHWCPELESLPTDLVHQPWKMTKEQQLQYDVRLGVDYPNPIIAPTAPNPYNRKNNKGKGQKGGRDNKRGGNNPNRGRGQRQDMKSLKPGEINFN